MKSRGGGEGFTGWDELRDEESFEVRPLGGEDASLEDVPWGAERSSRERISWGGKGRFMGRCCMGEDASWVRIRSKFGLTWQRSFFLLCCCEGPGFGEYLS